MGETFIDTLYAEYYEEIGDGFRSSFLPGQLFSCPIGYVTENLQFWRPSKIDDETKTSASDFHVVHAGKDAFAKPYPLYAPRLEINEEFLVVRAKKRPVVLLSPIMRDRFSKDEKGSAKVHKNLCVVAPLHSIYAPDGSPKFREIFVNRVRTLRYARFFFIPEHSGTGIRPSIMRIDSVQSVFHPLLEAMPLKLHSDVLMILQGQVEFFLHRSLAQDKVSAQVAEYLSLREQFEDG